MTRALRATRRHSLLIPSRTRVAGVLQCFAFEGRDLICQNTCQSESGGEFAQASGCEEGVGGTAPGYWPHRKACLKRREVDSGRWCPLEACAYLEGVPSSGRRKDVGTNAPMVSSCAPSPAPQVGSPPDVLASYPQRHLPGLLLLFPRATLSPRIRNPHILHLRFP